MKKDRWTFRECDSNKFLICFAWDFLMLVLGMAVGGTWGGILLIVELKIWMEYWMRWTFELGNVKYWKIFGGVAKC